MHVNRPLTDISIAYLQAADNFIATKVFPIVRVSKRTDSYFTYTKNDFRRDEMQIRPPGTESAGSGYGLSTATYSCDVFALHKDIDGQTLANSDSPLRPYEDATEFLMQRTLLKQEKQWAADAFVTGVWGTSTTPTNLWSAYAASTPITDVETAKRTVLIDTGYLPNTMAVGYDTYIQLINHPDIVDRLSNQADKIVNEAKLASIFGLPNFHICKASNNTAVEGETAVNAFVQGKHAWVGYVAPSPSLMAPSAGYTFVWDSVSGGIGEDVAIMRLDMPWLDSVRIEAQIAFDNKIVSTDLGYMFVSVVS